MRVHPAEDAPTIPHFLQLLQQSKALIKAYGRYTTYAGTTVFFRALVANNITKEISSKDLAVSLAAAQGCIYSAQVEGPAKEELYISKQFWDTMVLALEELLEAGDINHETVGWGGFGLSAGYMSKASWQEDS